MRLHNLISDVDQLLTEKEMSREAFARKHDLPSTWFNRFMQGKAMNPRWNSLERLERAIESERRAS